MLNVGHLYKGYIILLEHSGCVDMNYSVISHTLFSSNNGADGPGDGVDGDGAPTREAIMAMVEKDVAFSSPENRIELMNLIRKLTCSD